jgi:hypothetical protein
LLHDSRRGKRAHLAHAACFEHLRARVERRPRRAHIIHEDDDDVSARGVPLARGVRLPFDFAPFDFAQGKSPDGMPRQCERIQNVLVPRCCRQVRLRGGGADATKSRYDREAEVAGQIVRLIEPARSAPRRMQRTGTAACAPSSTSAPRSRIISARPDAIDRRPSYLNACTMDRRVSS